MINFHFTNAWIFSFYFQKKDIGGLSAFQQMLTKFFSTNNLKDVNPWLMDCVAQPIGSVNKTKTAQYVYTPTLPEVTTKPLSTFIQVR